MRVIETIPGESNASMISSIINLVCPQCAGCMMEFQCCGRCRRNWLLQWKWANNVTRSHDTARVATAGEVRHLLDHGRLM